MAPLAILQRASGDLFVTCSKTPYELRWRSPLGAEIDVIHMHLSVDLCFAAFQMVYQDKAGAVEVTEFFGRDETLAHLSFACAEMLSAELQGSRSVSLHSHSFSRFTSRGNTRTSHRRSLIITAAYRSHSSARSRTMSVRTWQRAFRLRSLSVQKSDCDSGDNAQRDEDEERDAHANR